MDSWNGLVGVITLIISGIGSMWGFSVYIQRGFSDVKDKLLSKMESIEDSILAKLEYHERHDDSRFNQIHKDVWELKLRNANIDGRLKAKFIQENREDK